MHGEGVPYGGRGYTRRFFDTCRRVFTFTSWHGSLVTSNVQRGRRYVKLGQCPVRTVCVELGGPGRIGAVPRMPGDDTPIEEDPQGEGSGHGGRQAQQHQQQHAEEEGESPPELLTPYEIAHSQRDPLDPALVRCVRLGKWEAATRGKKGDEGDPSAGGEGAAEGQAAGTVFDAASTLILMSMEAQLESPASGGPRQSSKASTSTQSPKSALVTVDSASPDHAISQAHVIGKFHCPALGAALTRRIAASAISTAELSHLPEVIDVEAAAVDSP